MTCIVSGGALNSTHSLTHCCREARKDIFDFNWFMVDSGVRITDTE